MTSEEKRHFKQEIAQKLSKQGITDATTLANRLVDIGICKDVESLLPLLQDVQALEILEVVYQFASLQKSIHTILTASGFAMHIVSALKRFTHNESGEEKTWTQVIEGIETVLTLYQHQLKHENIKIIRNYDTIPPILGYADELNQVWMNLIHNALQAMNQTGTLEISTSLQVEEILISFTDSGTGIPDEIKYTIFKPFFTTKPAGEGCGLGLDIVKKIIEKHNGKIAVESKPGCTTFTIVLPLNGQIYFERPLFNDTHLRLITID
jgi:signal transduction histidine kinase